MCVDLCVNIHQHVKKHIPEGKKNLIYKAVIKECAIVLSPVRVVKRFVSNCWSCKCCTRPPGAFKEITSHYNKGTVGYVCEK